MRRNPWPKSLRLDPTKPDLVNNPDPGDPMSKGMYWASRGMTVALEFVLPAVAGLWLDGRWSFGPLGVIAGAVLGFAIALMHLLRIAAEGNRRSGPR